MNWRENGSPYRSDAYLGGDTYLVLSVLVVSTWANTVLENAPKKQRRMIAIRNTTCSFKVAC